MSIKGCLDRAAQAGEITKAEAKELSEAFERLKAGHAADGAPDAAALAKAQLSKELAAEAAEKRRRALLQAQAAERIKADMARHKTARGGTSKSEAAIALLEHYGSAPYASVEGRRKAIIGRAHAKMSELLMAFERDWLTGSTPKAGLDNLVRELHGESTGDVAARDLAKAWGETSEWLRQRFNRAGGAIGKLENWGMPQSHDRLALLKAGRETWKASIAPRLAPERMTHPLTGEPMTASEVATALDHVYDSVTTEGWNGREPAFAPFGRGALATQRGEHRFLVFRSADDWLAYQREFGEGNPFATMMGHVNMMARDVAALEILGPNPNATVEWLKQSISKDGAGAASNTKASAGAYRLQAMWDHMRGSANVPVNEGLATTLAATRNVLTAAQLGSATLSSLGTDPLYQAISRQMAGLPVMDTLKDIAVAHGKGTREDAVASGLILDSAVHVFGENARWVGTLSGPEWSRRLADRTLALSGLTAWTQAGKHAFGMAAFRELAVRKDLAFDALPAGVSKLMKRYGLGAAEWDVMRSADLYEREGARFLRPNEVAAKDERVAERFLEMVLSETEYAVPSGTVRGATYLTVDRPGTLWGEVSRNFAQYKSFGATFALLYGARFWREFGGSKTAGAAYAGAVLTTTALGGALSIWLKDLASGRDPRPVSPAFAGAAMLQGGGLGIYGDFLFADLNRFGGGLAATLAGPLGGKVNELRDLTLGNAAQLAGEEDAKFTKEAIRFAGGLVPGSSLWYLKLGYQRLLLDQLQAAADPKANQAFKRRVSQARKDLKTDYWWRPGQTTPDRGPSLGGR